MSKLKQAKVNFFSETAYNIYWLMSRLFELFARLNKELRCIYHIRRASSISFVEKSCCYHLHQLEVHIQALEVLQRIPASHLRHHHRVAARRLEFVVLELHRQSPTDVPAARRSLRRRRSAGTFDAMLAEMPCDRQGRHVGRNSCRWMDNGHGLGQNVCTVSCWTQSIHINFTARHQTPHLSTTNHSINRDKW